jgi:hypothetical protein
LSDKDFKVKNKLVVNGLTGGAGPLIANSNKEIDSVAFLTTIQGGTGTTTSPSAGQVLYSAGGTSYNPTAINTLDVKGASYSADAPSSPVIGQIWVESDTTSDSFDPNIIRRKSFTATAAQTTFTTDVPFIQGYEQVFFNGMLLVRNNDYTTTNDTTVVLTTGAAVNDVVEVVTITNLNSINAATTTSNTFTGNQTLQGSLIFNNNANATLNFQDALYMQKTGTGARIIIASDGKVGIGGNTPEASLDVGERSGDTKTAILARMAGDHGFQLTAFNGSATNASGNLAAKFGISYSGVGDNAMIKFYRGGSAVDGTIAFDTTQVERMRIDSSGRVGIGTTSSQNGNTLVSLQHGFSDINVQWNNATNTSYTNTVGVFSTARSANSAFKFIETISSWNPGYDPEHVLRGDGQAYADGSWNGGGADYAEYFEWEDGNPSDEDRRGYVVSLVNEKIKIAEEGDIIIGVISGNPAIVGDHANMKWHKKYLRDDFGSYILDENGDRIINPVYNDQEGYVSREDRPEWDIVGLMGKLRLRKGQVTGAGWIKMRDISETIEEWLVK